MAFNKNNYVSYWKQFSEYIRFERADNQCECRGICGVKHNQFLHLNERFFPTRCKNVNGKESVNSQKKVVLTVAHLDHKAGVCRCKKTYGFKCAKPDHVLALCQRCHLNLDRSKHIAVRRKNLIKKKDKARGLFKKL